MKNGKGTIVFLLSHFQFSSSFHNFHYHHGSYCSSKLLSSIHQNPIFSYLNPTN